MKIRMTMMSPLARWSLIVLLVTGCAPSAPDNTTGAPEATPEAGPPIDLGAIRPFSIDVPEEVLTDLRLRLARRRIPDQIPGTGWAYGTERDYLESLLTYWEHEFDWRAQEAMLNQFDQFKTTIDGLDIHFIHQRSPNENAMPLLMTHGWPGSFAEFAKVIGPLTDPEAHGGDPDDAFHLVIPSLPGFGFSDKPSERGYSPDRMSEVLASLMERVGYEEYGLQGGDWGAIISRRHAFQYPERLTGLHLNFVLAGPPAEVEDPEAGVPPDELARMRERQAFMANETGYQGIQGTKPQTLGYGLNDSPTGLAAWIVEKFHGWSDINGDLESKFTKDELLTDITIYWVTGTITSSTRIYYESRNAQPGRPVGYIEVPTAGLIFPAEIIIPPRRWVEAAYNLVRWTEMPQGGHFAALEEPDSLVTDVRAFFRELR